MREKLYFSTETIYLRADPTQDPIPCKQCKSCLGFLPLSNYGVRKYRPDGLNVDCTKCYAQIQRIYRVKRFKAKSWKTEDDNILRSTDLHNKNILEQALSKGSTVLYAFCPHLHLDFIFRIDYFKKSIGLFKDKKLYREFFFDTDLKLVSQEILDLLKMSKVRLEASELDLLNVKTTLYYIDPTKV